MDVAPSAPDLPGDGPPEGETVPVPGRIWHDVDGGKWKLISDWQAVPRKAGLLAIIIRRGLECQLVEWHPTYNMRVVARSRLHALAPSFIGSPMPGVAARSRLAFWFRRKVTAAGNRGAESRARPGDGGRSRAGTAPRRSFNAATTKPISDVSALTQCSLSWRCSAFGMRVASCVCASSDSCAMFPSLFDIWTQIPCLQAVDR